MATMVAPAPTEAEQAATDAHLRRMLQSPQFLRAETQSRLLAYLYSHRHEEVSEYALATEALGRRHTFDPSVDASVRVHISRLRRKLKDYYAEELGEPELLVIPTGTHQLVVLQRSAPAEPEAVVASQADLPIADLLAADSTQAWMRASVVLGTLCLALMATLGVLLVRSRSAAAGQGVPPAAPNAFWREMLQGTAPIKIVLPTPVFFSFAGEPSFRLRSVKVNDFDAVQNDPRFATLTDKLGAPALEQSYTVTWDTLAAINMARYLDSVGAKQRVSFGVTRDASATLLEQANVVLLGTHQTLQPVSDYLQSMNFTLGPGEAFVSNAAPAKGEQERYALQVESPHREIRPSIVAVLPGRAPGLRVLILQSRHTGALADMLSSAAGSSQVEAMWRAHGSPPFYEMVVDIESENENAIRTWPVTMHPYTAKAPGVAP